MDTGQLELGFDGRKRRRKGAGRPRKANARSPHEARPAVTRHVPRHVSLRVTPAIGRLRCATGYAAVRRGMGTCLGRLDFRITQFSIQHNHIHLVVEADDKLALANGLRAFMISTARAINRALGRRGAVFATRYHATALRTPRQVRAVLSYVLNNWRHHHEDRGPAQRTFAVDPYSSGPIFDGWLAPPPSWNLPPRYEPLPTAGALSWLLTTGWRIHPRINLREVPGADAARKRPATR